VLDALLMSDVDVIDLENEDGMLTVFAPHTESFKAKQALSEAFGEIDYEVDEIQFIPQNTAPVTGDDVEMFERFMSMLNDLDDVQDIYHNVEPS
jgi:transcriptional/translational regulatory protein YebC/TACO1